MPDEVVKITPASVPAPAAMPELPSLVEHAGPAARFAWDEFFYAEHHNPHTQKAYMREVKRFLAWAEWQGVELPAITPGMIGQYLVGLGGSPAKRNLALSAIRGFFDRLVTRHVVVLNPAASVRGVKDKVIEGKTPLITLQQDRTLMAAIEVTRTVDDGQGGSVETLRAVGLRDRAILATLKFTIVRGGAIAKLRLGDFQYDGTQFVLRFQEKGGKSREIPVRHDLEGYIRAYLDAAGLATAPKDSPLFRSALRRTGQLTDNPMTSKAICELVKRRLKDAALPNRLSPHSFRAAGVTDLLEQGIPFEEVQHLAGHANPQTTQIYDRRQRRVTRNIVERISS